MRRALALAVARLRARPGRTALAGLGIAAAGAMAGAALTVSVGLATGFDRAAERADLPDVIARFDNARAPAYVDRRVRALPDVAARSFRLELTDIHLSGNGQRTGRGSLEVLVTGRRRGYTVVEGRDVSDRRGGEVVIERGLADQFGLGVGDKLHIGRITTHVAGIAVGPDNVAFPLARTARVYAPAGPLERRFGPAPVNVAELWLRDPSKLDEVLTQARAVAYGLRALRFITRGGVRATLDQAAGLIVALLSAFALVTLGAAALMLAASASAEVQRRLRMIGVQRALGFTRAQVTLQHGVEGALVAAPAALLGVAAGGLAVAGPASDLLATLNELPPGADLVPWLVGAVLAIVAVVAAASAWPAWRAAGRPATEIMRGGDIARARRALRARRGAAGGGYFGLGTRLAAARRGRLLATVAALGAAVAVVLLMLSLAALLDRLKEDPALLGRRYQLTVAGNLATRQLVAGVPGVAAVGERYLVDGADAFALGSPVRLVAYPGDHTRFESPPLSRGRRVAAANEAEVGEGLAQALGLDLGATLAVELQGGEARFRVVGIDRALDNEGRIAYVQPPRVVRADPALMPSLAVRLTPGADPNRVAARLAALGAPPQRAGGATTSNAAFLGVLADVLRVLAGLTALVCLYALVQGLALTARERRSTVAVLRATGAGRREVATLFAGAAVAAVVPALLVGVAVHQWLLAPAVADLAAGYADLPVGAGAPEIAIVALALAALGLGAAAWMTRRAGREPVVAGLREE
jgi:predicted lysophospholipase L1 biosynthesis ABC-type transport system permease subunit